jgi:NAD(P)-dependent dehydrogenase (short-subunit alcohol dehydrogenase family)
MRTLTLEFAPDMIRVNSVHPTTVDTPMVMNEATYGLFQPGAEHPTKEGFAEAAIVMNALPIPRVEALDIDAVIK